MDGMYIVNIVSFVRSSQRNALADNQSYLEISKSIKSHSLLILFVQANHNTFRDIVKR